MTATLIIALTLVAESASMGQTGMNRVYTVIRNRSNGTIESMAKECLKPHQFSCWSNRGLMARAEKDKKSLNRALFIVRNNLVSKDVGKATNYLTRRLYLSNPPKWARGMRVVAQEGMMGHVFLVKK